MPRRQKTSPEAAFASSSLFRLPLEIRTMVYNLLLRGPQEVFVASGQFKRKSISRVGKSAPSSASFTCRGCGLAIGGSRSVFYRHRLFYCNKSRYNNAWSLTELDRNEYEGSGLSPAILRTCRLVHLEAVPILIAPTAFVSKMLRRRDNSAGRRICSKQATCRRSISCFRTAVAK
jgi:hypothetical protein